VGASFRREPLGTGETVRGPTSETRDVLISEETQIARPAADGRTNPEIGALRVVTSPRTVEYHLRKVHDKLDIRWRRELADALPARAASR
jgi:DNA-binding NarL/FixJ family response regulator